LTVDYLKPTPLGVSLELVGKIEEVKGRKVVVSSVLYAVGEARAEGRVVALRIEEGFGTASAG
jgi:hypothetical protein